MSKKSMVTSIITSEANPWFKVLPTGIKFLRKVEYEVWAKGICDILQLHACCSWWLGDMLNYGEENFGKKYTQAIELTGLDYGTLRNVAWICSKVSFRSDKLSFAHHACVAAMPPAEQKSWLKKAELNAWDRNELLRKIKAARALASGKKVLHSAPVELMEAILTFRNAAMQCLDEMPLQNWDEEFLMKSANLFYGTVQDIEKAFGWSREKWKAYVDVQAKSTLAALDKDGK